jgi:hypothetical protein
VEGRQEAALHATSESRRYDVTWALLNETAVIVCSVMVLYHALIAHDETLHQVADIAKRRRPSVNRHYRMMIRLQPSAMFADKPRLYNAQVERAQLLEVAYTIRPEDVAWEKNLTCFV